MPIVATYRNNKRSRPVQLVARNRKSRTEVKSFVHQDARYNYGITFFDGARFLTRAFYINRLSAHAVKRAPSKVRKARLTGKLQ